MAMISITFRPQTIGWLSGRHVAVSVCQCVMAAIMLWNSVDRFATAADPEPILLRNNQPQLFLDDHIVESIVGLERLMHQPEKRGAVILPDLPWELSLQTRCAPTWNAERRVWQIWLITSTRFPELAGTSYAESEDGIHWIKPPLGQLKSVDAPDNNFISVVPGDKWPSNAVENVVRDPHDPNPDRRYKGFYGAIGRRPMVSPDGVHWTLLDVPMLPSSDESNLSYDTTNRRFIASLKKGGPFGRSHAIWTSSDFSAWDDIGSLFHADAADQQRAKSVIAERFADPTLQKPVENRPEDYNADIYNIGIFNYSGLYIGLPAVYHATGKHENNTDGFHLIQLVCSRDLHQWQRPGDRRPFIGPSPVGPDVWDRTQLLPPSAPVLRDKELWFYYTGIKYRVRPQDGDEKSGAVCLAVLRRDGFMSLDAGDEHGELLTRRILVPPSADCRLILNMAVGRDGEARVALIGSDDQPLPGYSFEDCLPLTADDVSQVVTWKSGTDFRQLNNKPLRLRFRLKNASLYSFRFSDSPANNTEP